MAEVITIIIIFLFIVGVVFKFWTRIKQSILWLLGKRNHSVKITTGRFNVGDNDGFIGYFRVIEGRVQRKLLYRNDRDRRNVYYDMRITPITKKAVITYTRIYTSSKEKFVDRIVLHNVKNKRKY